MDIGAEISKKIQMAITAKLKELDAYVDDELPDYIMIMVANKKTQSQMTEALSLFLSSHTETFTSWLHNLLSSLRKSKGDNKGQSTRTEKESVTIHKAVEDGSQKKTVVVKELKQRKDSEHDWVNVKKQTTNSRSHSEAVISIDNNEMQDLFDEELIAESSAAEFIAPEVELQEVSKSLKEATPKITAPELVQKTKPKLPRTDGSLKRKSYEQYSSQEISKAKKDKLSSKTIPERLGRQSRRSKDHKRMQQNSRCIGGSDNWVKEKPVREWDRGKGKDIDEMDLKNKRHSHSRDDSFYSDSGSDHDTKKKVAVSSAISQMAQDPEFVSESDSDDNSKSKISSRVAYPKRTLRVPLNKQANKALFMKAVNAAEKSVKTVGAVNLKREISPESTKNLKTSSSRKKTRPIKSGKPEFAKNDARRKLQIKKAIDEALQSELLVPPRKTKKQYEEQRPSLHEDNNSFPSKSTSQNDSVSQRKPKLSGKTLKMNVTQPKPPLIDYQKSDQRKFIIQSDHQPSDDHVAFDSREALPRSLPRNTNTEQETSPQRSSTVKNSSASTMDNSKLPPNFIVTMDGVIRSKHTSQPSEEERKSARLKKFNFEKIDIALNKKDPSPIDKKPSAMQELEKMKEKILEVKRESTRLKQMQIKLAAVKAGQNLLSKKTQLPAEDELRSISIANVHYSTTEKQLSEYFSICGKVVRATILRDIATGHPKGFAYLEFEDTGAVTSALALNNTQLNSRAIRVTVKQPTIPSASYQPYRGYYKAYRGRAASAFPTRFRQSRFTRFGPAKAPARNKTWINPAMSQLGK